MPRVRSAAQQLPLVPNVAPGRQPLLASGAIASRAPRSRANQSEQLRCFLIRCELVFPCDWLCGEEFKDEQPNGTKLVTQAQGIPDGWEGMDCGPASMALFREKVLASKTVIWNGPAGVFEFDTFSKGTKAVLEAVAELKAAGGRGIIGGGDSATAAAKWDMEDKVTFVSTGGGASLELLEGKVLPGIAALDAK